MGLVVDSAERPGAHELIGGGVVDHAQNDGVAFSVLAITNPYLVPPGVDHWALHCC
jgi:hypothetical protein